MRTLAILIATSSLAHAGSPPSASSIDSALKAGKLAPLFAAEVDVRGLAFGDGDCERKFGEPHKVTGADRAALAACLTKQGFRVSVPQPHTGKVGLEAALGDLSEQIEIVLDGAQITAIVPYGADATDGTFATFWNLPPLSSFKPTAATKAAIEKTTEKFVHATVKVCHDADGKVTVRRVVDSSGLAAFDAELVKELASVTKLPVQTVGGKDVPACLARNIHFPKDLVQPVTMEKEPPPPPPPPAPPTPSTVPPTMLEGSRIGGDKVIAPDDADKIAMQRKGVSKVIASLKLCLDDTGAITAVVLLKSSGLPNYDAKLHDTIATTWKYKPFLKDGVAINVCTAVTFIYSQH